MNRYRLRRRFWNFCNDCQWWLDRNREGLIAGFCFGFFVTLFAFYFVLGLM